MPGLDGLELQQAMSDAGAQRSIFIIRKADIQTSVRAMKAGAIATAKSRIGPKGNSTRVRLR